MKYFILGVLTSTVFFNTTCSNKRTFVKVRCSGNIYDSIGGKGVGGIIITLRACDAYDGRNQCAMYTVGSATSDDSGHYYIKEKAARSDRYFISGNGVKFQELSGDKLENGNYTNGYLK